MSDTIKDTIQNYFNDGGTVSVRRKDDMFGARNCIVQLDDPSLDHTGYEHPAYTRGSNDAVQAVVRQLNKILGIAYDPTTEGNVGLHSLREHLRGLGK